MPCCLALWRELLRTCAPPMRRQHATTKKPFTAAHCAPTQMDGSIPYGWDGMRINYIVYKRGRTKRIVLPNRMRAQIHMREMPFARCCALCGLRAWAPKPQTHHQIKLRKMPRFFLYALPLLPDKSVSNWMCEMCAHWTRVVCVRKSLHNLVSCIDFASHLLWLLFYVDMPICCGDDRLIEWLRFVTFIQSYRWTLIFFTLKYLRNEQIPFDCRANSFVSSTSLDAFGMANFTFHWCATCTFYKYDMIWSNHILIW